ncbi:MAG TPA: hypothetical protein DDW52_06675 [Planctomycetaceae bacterium]|nr:hypothetical protein [Planctomycetaceae bacterium]
MTKKRIQHRFACVLGFAVLFIGSSARVPACTLCIGFPEKTDVDFLAESACVILARTETETPFTFSPRRTLKGKFDGSKINLLVDSMTRRRLASDHECFVLLVQSTPYGNWRSLGIVSNAFRPVVERLVVLARFWSEKGQSEQRWQFFLPLFGHDDPRIRQLAYLELGRAPYSVIRNLGRSVPRETYIDILKDPKYLKWRSLAILLLAQSESAADKALIRDSLRSAERFGLQSNLSAWAAAAIEIDGQAALQFIAEKYGRGSSKDAEEIEAIIAAISMHGRFADLEMQNTIVDLYRQILHTRPEFASRIAEDLLAWERWELSEQLSEILEKGSLLGREERLSVARYVRTTQKNEEPVNGSR